MGNGIAANRVDREWYENHGYVWRDGQWYRGERYEYHKHHHQNGYWRDGQYYRYDKDRVDQKRFTCRRERDSFALSLEQFYSQFAFQIVDLLAERRLGNVQSIG